MDIATIDGAKTILAQYKQKIDEEIEYYFSEYLKDASNKNLSSNSIKAIEQLKDFSCRPAKRIRGALAWYTYDQLAEKPAYKTGANLAISLELIQNYLLAIDDVMDRSVKRRGKPTIHKYYETELAGLKYSNHLAGMMAVSIGLLAQHLANSLIIDCQEPLNCKTKTLEILHENIVLTCYGQIDDLLCANSNEPIDETVIYSIYEAKSSYYTFINPIQMGAAMAGKGSKSLLKKISQFGRPAGLAFQIIDDVLGIFGDAKQTGKPNIDDLREGKYTLLVSKTFKLADQAGQSKLHEALGNDNISVNEAKEIGKLMDECGAKQEVVKIAEQKAELAKTGINSIDEFSNTMKDFYCSIVEYSVRRNK